jgi:hypothetical protein
MAQRIRIPLVLHWRLCAHRIDNCGSQHHFGHCTIFRSFEGIPSLVQEATGCRGTGNHAMARSVADLFLVCGIRVTIPLSSADVTPQGQSLQQDVQFTVLK